MSAPAATTPPTIAPVCDDGPESDSGSLGSPKYLTTNMRLECNQQQKQDFSRHPSKLHVQIIPSRFRIVQTRTEASLISSIEYQQCDVMRAIR